MQQESPATGARAFGHGASFIPKSGDTFNGGSVSVKPLGCEWQEDSMGLTSGHSLTHLS